MLLSLLVPRFEYCLGNNLELGASEWVPSENVPWVEMLVEAEVGVVDDGCSFEIVAS